MTSRPLTRDLISDTSLWRLILRVSPQRIAALLLGPESVERSVMAHCESLADGSVKALENAVYDNPLLLADFARVDVVFAGPQAFASPLPASFLRESMAEAMLPDFSAPRRIEAEEFPGGEMVYAVDADVFNFISRTFAAARVHHALAVNLKYLFYRNSTGSAHSFALCENDGGMTLVCFNGAGVPALASLRTDLTAADCAYFILASDAQAQGAVSVGGDPQLRNEVCNLMRKVVTDATILPLTLTEDLLRLRQLAPEATYDMLFLTQLCE